MAWIGIAGMVCGGVLSAAGVEGGFVGAAAMLGSVSLARWRQTRTRQRLARLPFPVRTTRTPANDGNVVEVVITFERPMAAVLLEDVLVDARVQLPTRLIVAHSTRSISIAQWHWWESTDGQLQQLADLLERWGRQLHVVASITEVLVVLVPASR